jgi:hypothetical protein
MILSRKFISTIAILSILVLSGISLPIVFARVTPSASVVFTPSAPTFVGTASAFLSGPTLVPASVHGPLTATSAANGTQSMPSLNPKPFASGSIHTNAHTSLSSIPPEVSCRGTSAGCLPVNSVGGGSSSNPNGINAYENRVVLQGLGAPYGTIEPPDQGLCAGNGQELNVENIGEMQVFDSNLLPVSGVISLDTVMGLTVLGWSSGGDIMCQYDYANGGHWFITQFVSTTPTSAGGPFVGCFAGLLDGCREGIAVSVTNNPLGAYNVYFLDPNMVNSDPGTGYLLNDYAKTATTADAFMLFYDEYNLFGGYNGVQQFAFSKNALENGWSSSSVNVAYENMGTNANLAIPANGVYQPNPLPPVAWYQVIPAQTTDPTQYDNKNGGTGFMIASLDFIGAGDNRTAAFDWTGLSALNSAGCSKCSKIAFGGELLSSKVTYQNEGAPCFAMNYAIISTFCGLGAQKVGPIPLGENCVAAGLTSGVLTCPESGIATNGDGATQAFYSNGMIWTAVSTVVNETFGSSSFEFHLGATYWGVHVTDGPVRFNIANSGILSAAHQDMEFPSMASSSKGLVLMAFTLSGRSYYPSTAFSIFGSNIIYVSALGQSPQDGFTEYQGLSPVYGIETTRPRWGDYNQAVFDPVANKFYFATEMIAHANCAFSTYLSDPTCGGTRSPSGNWGNSINEFPA